MWQAHGVFNPPPQSYCIVLISRIMGIIRIEPFPVDLCADPMSQKAVPLETGHPGIPISIVVTLEFAYRSTQQLKFGSALQLMLKGYMEHFWCVEVHCSI